MTASEEAFLNLLDTGLAPLEPDVNQLKYHELPTILYSPSTSGALRLTLRANGRPLMLSVARKGGVEAGLPDRVRQGYSLT